MLNDEIGDMGTYINMQGFISDVDEITAQMYDKAVDKFQKAQINFLENLNKDDALTRSQIQANCDRNNIEKPSQITKVSKEVI